MPGNPHSFTEPERIRETGSVLTAVRGEGGACLLPVYGSLFADRQTAGRGQYGRTWQSSEGNIHAAIRLPKEPPYSTLACAASLSAVILDELALAGFDVRLKWPNDIVGMRKAVPFKAGGVLIEDRSGALVAGIGINLNWAPPLSRVREGAALPPGRLADTDMAAAGPREASEFELWRRIAMRIASESPDALCEKWRLMAEGRLLWRGEPVALVAGDGSVIERGALDGISPLGGAVIETRLGKKTHTIGSLVRDPAAASGQH